MPEAAEACPAEMERPLGLGERLSLGAHLMMCRSCSLYREQTRMLRGAMHEYAGSRAPDGDGVPPVDEAPPGGQGHERAGGRGAALSAQRDAVRATGASGAAAADDGALLDRVQRDAFGYFV